MSATRPLRADETNASLQSEPQKAQVRQAVNDQTDASLETERQAPRPIRWAGVFQDAGPLARALIAHRPRTVALALLLLLASGLTEGFGFLMLIPLMHAAGIDATEDQSAIAEQMSGLAGAFGPQLNLPVVLVVFVAIAVVRSAMTWQRDLLLAKTRFGFIDQAREALHEAAARAKWQFLASQRQSDLQHVLTGDVHRIGMAVHHFMRAAVAGALAVTQSAIAFLISPLISTATLLAGVALLALTRSLRQRSRVLGDELTNANRAIFAEVTDFLAGLKVAKGHAAERAHVRRFHKVLLALRARHLAFAAINAKAQATLHVGGALALAAMAWFAIAEARLTLPELGVLVLLFARVMSALASLQRSVHEFAVTAPAFSHAQGMLRKLRQATEDAGEEAPQSQGDEQDAPRMNARRAEPEQATSQGQGNEQGAPRLNAHRMELTKVLEVRAVSFDYGRQAPASAASPVSPASAASAASPVSPASPTSAAPQAALTRVSLDIRVGELKVISGPSGAGKSTLADILLGLLEPASGAVLVDGVPLSDSNRRRWRRSCAYVPQDPYLFQDTIRANVAWMQPGATDEDIWRALRLAAADFVTALPRGLDTPVGDRGGNVSGGERQRIALARALVAEPTLLVLDEATSQLDAQTEQRIVHTLRSLRSRMTIVVMTHSEAWMNAADRTVLLDAGRMAAA